MILDARSTFPSTRSYVLKLHRDAEPERGHLVGRLENMSSGTCLEFASWEQLLLRLAQDAEVER
jgi:hypothetical protein